jgi:hypothetical protein
MTGFFIFFAAISNLAEARWNRAAADTVPFPLRFLAPSSSPPFLNQVFQKRAL